VSTLRKVYDEGYRRVCLGCKAVFKSDRVPTSSLYGHGVREIEMCGCGCDLIGYIVEREDGFLYICRTPQIDENSIRCDNTQRPV
jgi:hypothetical protein